MIFYLISKTYLYNNNPIEKITIRPGVVQKIQKILLKIWWNILFFIICKGLPCSLSHKTFSSRIFVFQNCPIRTKYFDGKVWCIFKGIWIVHYPLLLCFYVCLSYHFKVVHYNVYFYWAILNVLRFSF